MEEEKTQKNKQTKNNSGRVTAFSIKNRLRCVEELVTNGLDVVVEGPHEVGSGDLQLLRPLHVHLHRGRGLHG